MPIGMGGLVSPSRKPFGKPALDLLKHGIDVSGEIAYAVCKHIRKKDAAEEAILMLHDVLRFVVLNNLSDVWGTKTHLSGYPTNQDLA